VSEQLESRWLLASAAMSTGLAGKVGPLTQVTTTAKAKPIKDTRSDSTSVFIDNGGLTGDNRYQIGGRWTNTASGATGTTGNAITLTWSIVPDGTLLTSGNGEPNVPSDFIARMNAIYGTQATWLPIVAQVFSEWSAVAGVTYVYQPTDDGVTMSNNAPGVLGVRGDVRIGAHPIDGGFNVLAYDYFPNFGDMTIDSNDLVSGGFMFGTGNNSRALRNVMAHEHGHGLGFNHVDPINNTKLMEAFASTNFDGPQFDDILAANRNYGDIYEKSGNNNAPARAVDRGTLGEGSDVVNTLSMSTTGDQDYFKFNLTQPRAIKITVAPQGTTYQQGAQGGTTTAFNAKAQMDLQFQLIASDGSTVLQTINNTAAGSDEIFNQLDLPAGTYYIRVSPATNALNSAQMYRLTTLVGQLAIPLTDSISTVSPNVRQTPVDSLDITFSEAIDPSSFNLSDITLTRDTIEESLADQGATLTSSDNIHWTLGNLTAATNKVGSFVLTLGTDVQTSDGRTPNGPQTVNWQMTAINGTSGDDDIRVARAAGFDNFSAVYFGGSATEAYLFSLGTLTTLNINGQGGNDRITVDYTSSNPAPSGGITVDGGSGSDTLVARGASTNDAFNVTATTVRHNSPISTSTYSNVEALDLNRGRFTFTADVNGPDVTLEDEVTGIVNTTQHLGALSVLGTATLTVGANGSRLLGVRSLAIDPTAYVELNDNDMLVDYTGTSPLSAVQGLINTGRNGGTWTSFVGLGSTAAANANPKNTTLGAMEATDYKSINGAGATFDGAALDDTAILVKYTYYGDTDFNGKVNFDDYVRTDNGFNNHLGSWMNGDFDGNGSVNFDDYVLIDLAFNSQGTVL